MKEAEREIGSLYHELLLKEVDAKVLTKRDSEMILLYYFIWFKMEREEQTQLAAHYRNMEQVSLLNQQVKGKVTKLLQNNHVFKYEFSGVA